MIFFVNGRFLTQKPTGVQFFAQKICSELENEVSITYLTPKEKINSTYATNQQNIKQIGIFKGHLWEQISLPWFLFWKKNWFLLNFCNTAPLFIKNQLVSVHDLAFMRDEKWFNLVFKFAYQFLIPKILKKSVVVATVSETVKKEIQTQFKISSNKINVLTNKLNDELIKATPIPLKITDIKVNDYYLMVGSENPRKNFAWVENIFTIHFPSKMLVIVGSKHQSFSSTNKIFSKKIIRISSASANELAWLYKNAFAFINPSHYEGFGIPNLEAMYFNCPILCSDIAVFKEVCKSTALYFKLGNEQDFMDKITRIEKIDLSKNEHEIKQRLAFYQEKNRAKQLLSHINL